MKAEKQTAEWQKTARAVLSLLAAQDLPLRRRGLTIEGKINVRVRPHPACGAPVLELMSGGVRGGYALGWRDFRQIFQVAPLAKRTFTVLVRCPDLRKQKSYRVVSTSNSNAWNRGLRRFFDEFPRALTDGLAVGGDCKIAN